MCCERWSNEAATVHADITADHRDVPARFDLEIPNGPAFSYNKILAFAPVCSRQSRIGLWFRLADVSGRRHSVGRSFGGSFRFDGHAELDGPPLPFQVSLPVLLGIGNLGRRVAPLSVQYTLS